MPFASNVRGKKGTKVEISISTTKPLADSFRTIHDNKKSIGDWKSQRIGIFLFNPFSLYCRILPMEGPGLFFKSEEVAQEMSVEWESILSLPCKIP